MLDGKETKRDQMTLPSLGNENDAPPVEADWRKEVPTVSQLTRRIRGHLEAGFFEVWVKGEISNFRKPVSGHVYFCMKDATAQLKAVMFRTSFLKVKFQVQDGMEVLLHGKITVYEARGEYQLIADAIEPVGVGALQLAFEQLKQKLLKEGLFDARHKKPLPQMPKRIGMVTSATGAAVKDVLKVLARRFPNLHVVVIPASVQGDKAAPEICHAIGLAERWNAERPHERIEVLIVGRGGGSLEDLWPFNEETVARAIFKCAIPIISAVGHEIDFTIADFVADVRAPTPSAAAEIVVPRKDELQNGVRLLRNRLAVILKKQLEQTRLHLGHLSQRLVDPRERVKLMKRSFSLLEEKLEIAMRMRLKLCRKRLEGNAQLLNSLSPLNVIGRGYSLARGTDGMLIHSVTGVGPGQKITLRVSDGSIESEVLSVKREPL